MPWVVDRRALWRWRLTGSSELVNDTEKGTWATLFSILPAQTLQTTSILLTTDYSPGGIKREQLWGRKKAGQGSKGTLGKGRSLPCKDS